MNFEVLATEDTLEVSDDIFDRPFNESLVAQVVQLSLANGHTGTRAQKNRARVRGSNRKPWRQKGMGRSRAGTRSSPIWRGGGVTFAALPDDKQRKVNRKMFRGAMCCILSELNRTNRLHVCTDFTLPEPKTKSFLSKLHDFKLDDVLVVDDEPDANAVLAARNLNSVNISKSTRLLPQMLLRQSNVLFTVGAIKQLEESLS